MSDDPGFVTAVERAYLALLQDRETIGQSEESLHRELLDRAIYMADPSNGGLRFKKLSNAIELDARLLRALSKQKGTEKPRVAHIQ